MLKPSYKIQIKSEIFELGRTDSLINLIINQDIDIPASTFELVFNEDKKTLKINQGDDISIKLGEYNKLTEVFKGIIDLVEPTAAKVKITGFNLATKLLDKRLSQVYEKQTAGKIASDLVKKGGLSIEKVEEGIKFPYYSIDDGKNVYDHIRELAERCGYDAYFTVQNKVVFKKYSPENPMVFEYGKDIIEINAEENSIKYTNVIVQGEGPSSFKGEGTTHWLTKKQVEGSGGKGTELIIIDPTVRDKATADKIAKARLSIYNKKFSGTLKVVGIADLLLGDTIEIKGMTNPKMNGEFQVRGIEHVFNKEKGFTTLIKWRE